MDIKKFSDFTVLQKFTVLNYYMWPVDETDDLDTFKIAGDNGFPNAASKKLLCKREKSLRIRI